LEGCSFAGGENVVSLQMCSFEGFLHTNYKLVGGPRYPRNPIKGWQDWVKVLYGFYTVHELNSQLLAHY